MRFSRMETFQMLYLKGSLLQRTKEVQARNVIEAVGKAAGQPRAVRIEIWRDESRVAVVGPRLDAED
jgi:hypothetical protein